jgi:hypothetical protein
MLTLLQWGLGIGGLLVLAIGLFWDRPGWRGRAPLRCRKCWFDLTGSRDIGSLNGKGVLLCPECGTVHRSVRQLRRIKKKSWAIILAALLLTSWIPAQGWSRYREVGWPGLVPTAPLAACTVLIPSEPDTEWLARPNYTPNGPSRIAPIARLRNEIMDRLQDPDEYGLIEKPVLIWIARRESDAVLTDPTSLRGTLYRTVITRWHRDGRLSVDEERWADGINHFELSCEHPVVRNGDDAYADVRLRRLLHRHAIGVYVGQEMYQFSFGSRSKGFSEPRRITSNRSRWGVPGKMRIPCRLSSSGLPETWDATVQFEVFRGSLFHEYLTPIAIEEESFRVRVAEVERSDKTIEYPRSPIYMSSPYKTITGIDGVDVIDDPDRYVEWLAEACSVLIKWNDDDAMSAPPDRFSVHFNMDYMDANPIEAFTFGGTPTLVVHYGELDSEKAPRTWDVLLKGSAAWWSIRDGKTEYGARLVQHNMQQIGFYHDDFESNWIRGLRRPKVTGAEIIITFGGPPRVVGDYGALSDPELSKLLTAPVRIPIKGHALRRIQAMFEERIERHGRW